MTTPAFLAAPGAPRLRASVYFGAESGSDAVEPTDISEFVRVSDTITVKHGRTKRGEKVTPSSLSLTLDNPDGRFTLGSTYFGVDAKGRGLVRPGNRIRLTSELPAIPGPNFLDENETAGLLQELNEGDWGTVTARPLMAYPQDTPAGFPPDGRAGEYTFHQGDTGGVLFSQTTPASAGQKWSASAFALDRLNGFGATAVYALLEFVLADGTVVRDRDELHGATYPNTGPWVRPKLTSTAPAGTIAVRMGLQISGIGVGGAFPFECWVTVGGLMLQQGNVSLSYIAPSADLVSVLFDGYVDGWPVTLEGADSIATVSATDVLKRLGRRTFRGMLAETILAGNLPEKATFPDAKVLPEPTAQPLAYWPMGEPDTAGSLGNVARFPQPSLKPVQSRNGVGGFLAGQSPANTAPSWVRARGDGSKSTSEDFGTWSVVTSSSPGVGCALRATNLTYPEDALVGPPPLTNPTGPATDIDWGVAVYYRPSSWAGDREVMRIFYDNGTPQAVLSWLGSVKSWQCRVYSREGATLATTNASPATTAPVDGQFALVGMQRNGTSGANQFWGFGDLADGGTGAGQAILGSNRVMSLPRSIQLGGSDAPASVGYATAYFAHLRVFRRPQLDLRILPNELQVAVTAGEGQSISDRFEIHCAQAGLPPGVCDGVSVLPQSRNGRAPALVSDFTRSQPMYSSAATTVTPLAGQPVLEVLESLESTEMGVLFYHPNRTTTYEGWYGTSTTVQGTLCLYGRRHAWGATPRFILNVQDHAVDDSLVLTGDDTDVVNEVTATRPGGGTIVVTDIESQDAFGLNSDTLEMLVNDDEELLHAARYWMLGQAWPQARCEQLTIDVLTNPHDIVAALLTLDILDRFRVGNLPASLGVSSMGLVVQGWTHTISTGEWTVTIDTSDSSFEDFALVFADTPETPRPLDSGLDSPGYRVGY